MKSYFVRRRTVLQAIMDLFSFPALIRNPDTERYITTINSTISKEPLSGFKEDRANMVNDVRALYGDMIKAKDKIESEIHEGTTTP